MKEQDNNSEKKKEAKRVDVAEWSVTLHSSDPAICFCASFDKPVFRVFISMSAPDSCFFSTA